MFSRALVLAVLFSVVSCGGGGGDSSTPTPVIPEPSTPDNGAEWTATAPNYTGIRATFDITQENSSEVAFGVIESLDLLIMLVFSDEFPHLYFLKENRDSLLSDNANCESGSVTSREVEAQKRIEVEYKKCVIDGTEINGHMRAINNTSSQEITVIPSLTLKDLSTNEEESLKGYYKYVPSKSATFQLLISNSSQEEIWFNDFTLELSQYGDNYGIYFNGEIYVSDLGKLTISTTELGNAFRVNSIYTSEIKVASNSEVNLKLSLQETLTIELSDQFIPVVIPLTEYPDSLLDGSNAAPNAIITVAESHVERNNELVLSSLDSYDPDFDSLSYLWEVTSKPAESNVNLTQGSTSTFSADVPGIYTIKLTVSDSSDASSFIEKQITVLKGAPKGQISVSQPKLYISEPISATVDLENDEADGPFQYKIKYGPANMSVDAEGKINWNAVIPNFGVPTTVNFAVFVSNQDKNAVIEKSIVIEPASGIEVLNRTDSAYVNTNTILPSTSGNNDKLYFGGHRVAKLFKDNTRLKIFNDVILTQERNAIIKYQGVSDVNNDSVDDFWYSYIDRTNKKYSIYWKDGKTGETTEFMSFDDIVSGSYASIEIQLLDFDLNGKLDIAISTSKTGLEIFTIENKSKLLTLDSTPTQFENVCDYNQDGYLDYAYDDQILDIKNNEVLFSSAFRTVNTNEESCRLLYSNAAGEFVLSDINGENSKVVLDRVASNFTTSAWISGNFDGKAGDDVMIFGYVNKQGQESVDTLFLIGDLDKENITTTEIAIDENLNIDMKKLYTIWAVRDIDKNGVDEFYLSTTDLTTAETIHRAFSIDNSSLYLAYSSLPFIPRSISVLDWQDDNTLMLFSNKTDKAFLAKSTIDSPLEYLATSYADRIMANIEDNAAYLYSSEHPNHFLSKQDVFGNENWKIDIKGEDDFGLQTLAMLPNGLVEARLGYSDKLVDATTGNILLRIPEEISFGGTQRIFYGSDNMDFYASIKGRKLLKIAKDHTIETFVTEAITELLEESTHYTFTQYDDDPLLELITYSTFRQEYQAIDLTTGEQEEVVALHDGKVENSSNIEPISLLECFKWDINCRNYVSNKNKASFEVVDKLTGTIIWQSPRFFENISSVSFRKKDNKVDSAISFGSGYIYTFTSN